MWHCGLIHWNQREACSIQRWLSYHWLTFYSFTNALVACESKSRSEAWSVPWIFVVLVYSSLLFHFGCHKRFLNRAFLSWVLVGQPAVWILIVGWIGLEQVIVEDMFIVLYTVWKICIFWRFHICVHLLLKLFHHHFLHKYLMSLGFPHRFSHLKLSLSTNWPALHILYRIDEVLLGLGSLHHFLHLCYRFYRRHCCHRFNFHICLFLLLFLIFFFYFAVLWVLSLFLDGNVLIIWTTHSCPMWMWLCKCLWSFLVEILVNVLGWSDIWLNIKVQLMAWVVMNERHPFGDVKVFIYFCDWSHSFFATERKCT